MLNDAPVNVRTLFEISNCRSAFSFASPKENAGSSEPASSERAPAIRGVSYPLRPFLPLQIANASLVCNLRAGGISISPRSPLEPTQKNRFGFSGLFPRSLIELKISAAVRRGGRLCPPGRLHRFFENLRRIRTSLQILSANLIYSSHSKAAACKSVVP